MLRRWLLPGGRSSAPLGDFGRTSASSWAAMDDMDGGSINGGDPKISQNGWVFQGEPDENDYK